MTTETDTTPPDDLRLALAEAGLLDAFLRWAPSHRREWVRSVEEAVKPETRARRVALAVEGTRAKAPR